MRIIKIASSITTVAAISGCSTPRHTDLLIFGTNTQFGISASAEATANPGVSIGYRRQELVLMPLYVNAQDTTISSTGGNETTVEKIKAAKYQGTDGAKFDTYSVFASFGASGGGGAKTADAKVGIAQYFATGLAARILAVAGGSLVNTSGEAAEASKQTAVAAAKMDSRVQALSDAATRFDKEATLSQAYQGLSAAKKSAFIKAANAMYGQVNGAPLTESSFDLNIQHLSDAQIDFALSQINKL